MGAMLAAAAAEWGRKGGAIDDTRAVEERGMRVLRPYLRGIAYGGQVVFAGHGPTAELIQVRLGDALVNPQRAPGELLAVEIKIEAENRHGNFFLEDWSNKNFQPRRNGWLRELEADYLLYYFLREDELYTLDFPKLWWWAVGQPGQPGRLQDFPERVQGKHEQRNRTCGRCVPIATVREEVGFRLIHPLAELRERGLDEG